MSKDFLSTECSQGTMARTTCMEHIWEEPKEKGLIEFDQVWRALSGKKHLSVYSFHSTKMCCKLFGGVWVMKSYSL